MIYITGDCHNSFRRFTKKRRNELPFELTEGDYIIVCGDFGLCWEDNDEFKYNCNWLGSLPFRILFVDGNHENHTMLNNYPVEIWNGGKVHHIVQDKIIHLMRGQVFTINGKTFFTMGGASSHDVYGGVLDMKDPLYNEKRKQAIRSGNPYRVIGKSFWYEELPSQDELNEGLANLAKVDYNVDCIISHCLSSKQQDKVDMYKTGQKFTTNLFAIDILTEYFNDIEEKVQYKHWYCGHYHENLDLDEKHTILYEDIAPIREI